MTKGPGRPSTALLAEMGDAEDAAAAFVAAIQAAKRRRFLLAAALDAERQEIEALAQARDAPLSRHPYRGS